jgi:Calpain family cysteine protease
MSKKLSIGVPNPRALTEIVLRRRVDWKRVADPKGLIEHALGVKWNELFDPKSKKSPLFVGLRDQPEVKAPEARKKEAEPSTLKAVKARTSDHKAVTLRDRRALLPWILRRPVPSPEDTPWTPDGSVWLDPGTFFDEGTEFSDPVQGGLADCWLIAAMAAVAWARPYTILQRNRATGTADEDFVDEIDVHNDDGTTTKIEVTERINVVSSNHGYQWARSSETGEIWPAVYEKAFAKWRSNNHTDRPDMTALNYGDCVDASLNLTGLAKTYYGNDGMAAHDIWQTVRANSLSYKTVNPMTCWTYGTPPAGVDYVTANIVGNHCYTILGWDYASGTEYVVLRNPWGWKEATLDVLTTATWSAYDGSFWRGVALNTGGVFAIKATTFKQYFAGFGVVK